MHTLTTDRYAPKYPVFKQIGRTGSTRYTPTVKADKYGRVFIYNPDSIPIQEYDEMRFHGQIKAGLTLLKLPIIQAKWGIQCEDQDISAFITEVLKPIWPTFIRQTLLAFDFGFSVFEMIQGQRYNLRITRTQGQLADKDARVYKYATVIEKMMHLDPLTLYLLAYRWSGDFAGVRQYIPDAGLIPKEKCFIFSNDIEYQEWYGISRLKACYPYWIYSKLMLEFTGVFYETYSVPMRIGRYPTGRTDLSSDPSDPDYINNMDHMLNIVEEMRNNHAIVLPSDFHEMDGVKQRKWDVEPFETNRTGGDHMQFMSFLNMMLLKSLLVPQLALETGGVGSYGLGEQQIKFFMLNEQATMTQIEDAINSQILPIIQHQNFGANSPRALFRFQPINDEMIQGVQNTFINTIGTGQPIPLKDGSALMVDLQWLADSMGVPVQYLKQHEVEEYVAGVQMLAGMQPAPPDQNQPGEDPNAQQNPNQPPGQEPVPQVAAPVLSDVGVQTPDQYRRHLHQLANEMYDWRVENGELVCVKKATIDDLVTQKRLVL